MQLELSISTNCIQHLASWSAQDINRFRNLRDESQKRFICVYLEYRAVSIVDAIAKQYRIVPIKFDVEQLHFEILLAASSRTNFYVR